MAIGKEGEASPDGTAECNLRDRRPLTTCGVSQNEESERDVFYMLSYVAYYSPSLPFWMVLVVCMSCFTVSKHVSCTS